MSGVMCQVSNALPLGLLVLLEVVLVEALQVGDHAPVVELGGHLPPPEMFFPQLWLRAMCGCVDSSEN